jgi:hypothetical protein
VTNQREVSATTTITVTTPELIAACQELRAAGVAMVGDLDAAYDQFRSRRAAYDHPLLDLCAYVYAPGSLGRVNIPSPSSGR